MPRVRRVERYVLFEDPLARGGMATVFLGRLVGASGFARTVAIKRMHQHLAGQAEFVRAFVDEAKLAARIKHPNVVPTLDVVSAGEDLLLVMEHVHGLSLSVTLRSASERGVGMPLPVASAIVCGALHGLHAAHEAVDEDGSALAIVHRDVSPQNILVGADGIARVLDFGVAKAARRLAQETQTGIVKGKLAYMAPEQFMDEEVTRLADVYAAGVVFWEMLTRRQMFKSKSGSVGLYEPMSPDFDPPSKLAAGIPPALDAAVMRALARDPRRRYATARDFALAIEAVVPPASSAVVSTWMEEACSDLLRVHRERVREIESTPTEGAVSDDTVATTPAPTASPEGALTDLTFASGASKPRARRWWIPLVAVVLAGGAVAAAAALVVHRERPAPPLASAPPPAPVASDAPPAPSLPVPVTASAPPSASVSAPAPKVALPARPPRAKPAPSDTASGDPCKPPYWIDSDNVRHPKPQCQ
jgi:eukaryotic-like serine/threonine-protein kinase